jgi:NAD(P)H-dependent FMN reductase
MHRLGVITASVREGRAGAAVTEWFLEIARRHGGFDVAPMDLKAIDLPLLQEPAHPRLQEYTHEKTKRWSAAVAAADAFVIVMPEYNFSIAPALLNALDHLYVEWNYKAAGIVSYGGVSGGLRAAHMTRQVLTTFKVVPLVETVAIPFFSKLVDPASGRFAGGDAHEKAAAAMLHELDRWTGALAVLRR